MENEKEKPPTDIRTYAIQLPNSKLTGQDCEIWSISATGANLELHVQKLRFTNMYKDNEGRTVICLDDAPRP